MSPLEIMRARLAEARTTSAALLAKRAAIVDKTVAEQRGITDAERTELDSLKAQRDAVEADIPEYAARVVELEADEQRELAARTARVDGAAVTDVATVVDPEIYVKNGTNGRSFFKDLAQRDTNPDAADRLRRNTSMVLDAEQRALGNTGAAGGSGGEFAPPAWMISEWVNIIRAGRVTIDLFESEGIPDGVSSVNIPKISGGTTTAIQSTQNTALSQTDMTTTYVQTGWATIGGKQVVAQQLLDQSAINLDKIILKDLAADYAKQVGAQTFTGSGNGTGTSSVVNGLQFATIGTAVTWTQGSPTGPLFYSQCAKLVSGFVGARLENPRAFVMHPRRWYWLTASLDSQNRPLLPPTGPAFNVLADQNNPVAMGLVGVMHGFPVYIDPQVPTNIGAGTNQDVVYLLKTDDLIKFEGAPRAESFRETYADSVGVLFRFYSYLGTMLNRHSESLGTLNGTGLITPTFAG